MEHDLAERAKAHFGITYDPREAGYILADGTMLDLSGRHQVGEYIRDILGRNVHTKGHDWMAARRVVDHRELDDLVEAQNGTFAMRKFMSDAPALRFHPSQGFEINTFPTARQIASAVVAHFSITAEPLLIDVANVDGGIIDSKAFVRPSAKSVMIFITNSLKK
jgi:hypothetical protein